MYQNASLDVVSVCGCDYVIALHPLSIFEILRMLQPKDARALRIKI